ncbi:C-type lectin domain family 10 member A-like [Gymnodraco acuticeps]|uniref:C-type lectin domain family 10 member A-like n=1 Tax=Gymnodraco acuticeps TaxID=8218 RepID=A0A6P8VSY4_GYMAC|nr:C-type lectin domain family 10 member A-like [Gymnodraco acuticeps]
MKGRISVLLFLTALCSIAQCSFKKYHFIDELSWLNAQTYCRKLYTDLATVSDMEDMNQLLQTAKDSMEEFGDLAWIGLNFKNWTWSFSDEDNESFYRNWDERQPDNFGGDQMCVKMSEGGLWEDEQCSLRNSFICYDGTGDQRFIWYEQELTWDDAQL